MPKYRPSLPIEDCYGSVGELTYYHRNGACFYKKRPRPAFPGTMRQMEQQSVHLRAIAAWQQLEPDVQKRWNSIAPAVIVHRPPFDGTTHMSGYNLFVSAYHGFATLGCEHLPTPKPFEKFPTYTVGILGASAEAGTLQIRWKLEMEDSEDRYRLLTKVQLGRPGRGWNTGALRNYLAEGTANDAAVTTSIPDYVSVYGLDLQSYQVHARCILLDTKTGYRSQFLAVSGIIEL